MEYTFNFRYDREGDGMVFTSGNDIGGMINNVGTMFLTAANKADMNDFKKYCKDNKITCNPFLGSDNIVTVSYKDFEVNGVPRNYIHESYTPTLKNLPTFDQFVNEGLDEYN